MYPDAAFTGHALEQMARRNISELFVRQVLECPEQWGDIGAGRKVLQSRFSLDEPERVFVVRVFVDVERKPPEVVTVYRSSKVSKYWREDV